MSEVQYLIYNKRDGRAGWMDHCIVWWRPKSCGYTYSVEHAGRYSEDESRSIAGSGNSDLVAVPESVVLEKQKAIAICYLDDLPHKYILEKDGRRRVRQVLPELQEQTQ